MSSGGQVPQMWEVWHARFEFSEGRGYKYRSVIVVGLREDGSLVMMVTGAANKLSLPHDYLIRDGSDCAFHDARHMFVTMLISGGADVRTVARYLRHAALP